MLATLLRQSFTKQKRAMALMLVSVAMGTAVSASLIAIALDIKGKVSRELRSFGANITIEPRVEGLAGLAGQRRFLREDDIVRAKTIFWRHNIVGIAPFLDAEAGLAIAGRSKEAAPESVKILGTWFRKSLPLPGEDEKFAAGTETVAPWWEVKGSYPKAGEVLVGITLATKAGLRTGYVLALDGIGHRVVGSISTGGPEDERIFMDLDALQALKSSEGAVSRVMVSALTTPMDEFAYKDPRTMSKPEYEKWYCTGYVTSIAKQLEEVFQGSRAKPIWQVAETEGRVLERLTVLIYLLTLATLVASALGMSTTMAASVLRRLEEVALMKAVGADRMAIVMIFLSEALLIGFAGGFLGYLLSLGVSYYIGVKVFSIALVQRGVLLPAALALALVISAVGSLLPIRRALVVKPAIVLKEAH